MALAAGACLSVPPEPEPGICSPVDDVAQPDPLLGNVLTYTFDGDVTETEVVHDSSGNRLDGALEGAIISPGGIHGLNAEWAATQEPLVEVPASPLLHLGTALTIEMWVWRNDQGIDNDHGLLSFYDPELAAGEYILEIFDDGLWFGIATGDCANPVMQPAVVPSTILMVDQDTYIHLAVTWDGDQVSFYRNGDLVAELPLDGEPCPLERPLYLGATDDELLPFAGWLDDVKISDYVKTEEQIRASMNHDPSVAGPVCGNHLLEAGEDCEPPALCCDPDTCRHAASSCGCAGECAGGLCVNAGAGRAQGGVVALYDFEEGSGRDIADSSGTGLTLNVMGENFSWGTGSLILTGADTAAVSGTTATAVVDACQASDEVTLEVWFTPAGLTDDHEIVAMLGLGDSCAGFALLQHQDRLAAAVGSELTETDGAPYLDTPPGAVESRVTQAVLTRSADGVRRLYVDGRLRAESIVAGELSTWNAAQRLTLGGPLLGPSPACETGIGRFWQGELHRLVVYARALDQSEVADNYAAGPES